jgi:hypothetical protein
MILSSAAYKRYIQEKIDCWTKQIKVCNESAKKMMRDFIKLLDTWSICHLKLQNDVHAPDTDLLKPLLLGATAIAAVIILGVSVFLIHSKKLCVQNPVVYERMNTMVLSNIMVEG